MAAGLADKDVAAEIGVVPKTIQRLKQRDDFRALVRSHRDAIMPETITAEAVLTSALSATKKDGQPDWQTRVTAARAILATPVTDAEARAEAERVTTIFLPDPEEVSDDPPADDGAPRPFPITGCAMPDAATARLSDRDMSALGTVRDADGVLVAQAGRVLAWRPPSMVEDAAAVVITLEDEGPTRRHPVRDLPADGDERLRADACNHPTQPGLPGIE